MLAVYEPSALLGSQGIDSFQFDMDCDFDIPEILNFSQELRHEPVSPLSVGSTDHSMSTDRSSSPSSVIRSVTELIVKASKSDSSSEGSKKTKSSRKKVVRSKATVLSVINAPPLKAINVSRTKIGNTILAFPAFDKCDSLLFLPNTMARCFNSADRDGWSKLIKNHYTKDCVIDIKDAVLTPLQYIKLFDLMTDAHPDVVSACTNTVIENNLITTTWLCKFTDIKYVVDSMAKTIDDPFFIPFFMGKRHNRICSKLDIQSVPETEREDVLRRYEEQPELTLYNKARMVFTIDSQSNKICHMLIDHAFVYLDRHLVQIYNPSHPSSPPPPTHMTQV